MELHKRVMRTCVFVVVGAILLRILAGAPGKKLAELMSGPNITRFLLSVGTGRFPPKVQLPDRDTAQNSVTEPSQEAVSAVRFSQQDIRYLAYRNSSGYGINSEELLKNPLNWELAGEIPTVLILHTHATESYTKTENYTESAKYRTLNCNYNVVSVGDRLAQLLEAGGIRVIHDRTLHDNPSYNNSYNYARQTAQKHLTENPGIQLVIDLHRDAMEDSNGQQIASTVVTDKGKSAQMMMVVGTDSGGFVHPDWQENLALAAKLQVLLERQYSGLCRPINLRSQRFNQDMSPGALLIEMGAAGNTRQEALVAAELLAQAILTLSHGCSYN